MYETVNEPIRVLASFGDPGRQQRDRVDEHAAKVKPLAFAWRNHKYKVSRINLVHTTREGGDVVYYFSVSDAVHYFKLKYNGAHMKWWLEEVYTD